MSFCPNCGSLNPDDFTFCGNCGANLLPQPTKPSSEHVQIIHHYHEPSRQEAPIIEKKGGSGGAVVLLLILIILIAVALLFGGFLKQKEIYGVGESGLEKTTTWELDTQNIEQSISGIGSSVSSQGSNLISGLSGGPRCAVRSTQGYEQWGLDMTYNVHVEVVNTGSDGYCTVEAKIKDLSTNAIRDTDSKREYFSNGETRTVIVNGLDSDLGHKYSSESLVYAS